MNDHDDASALETAKDLTEALTGMAAEVKRLRTYGRRNRKWIVFDIAITVLLAVVTFVAVHASQSARSAEASAAAARAVAGVAQQNNRDLCLSTNVARAQQIALWDYLLNLSGGKPRTTQQEKTVTEFRRHLEVVFQPRNCTHVNPGNPGLPVKGA